MTADAVLRTLRHAWLTLDPLGLPMAVTGGLALAVWRHVRATRDVDLLVGVDEDGMPPLLETLFQAGIRPKRTAKPTSIGQLEVVQLLYEPPEAFMDLQLDLLIASSGYHRQSLSRRVPAHLPDLDLEIAVLACEDLILHKLLAGRIIDRADAAALLRANRDSLDLDYLTGWIGKLELAAAWNEAWNEAFPGE